VDCCASKHPPNGYWVDPSRLREPVEVQLEPAEAAVVAEMFVTSQQETQSLMGITSHLIRQQVSTPGGRWRWNQATVRGILANPVSIGIVFTGR
jgi:site-specific DNA recombinase